MRQRGITLIELLLALFVASLVIAAAGSAYVAGGRTAQTLSSGRDVAAKRAAFENGLTDLFEHAFVDPDATNTNTYFLSGDAISSSGSASVGATTTGGSSGANSSSGSNDSIAFTVLGRRLPSTTLASTDDFETNNGKYGALGGVTEVELGTTPVGSPSGGETGLFLREQTPSDADASQGGEETVLSSEVESVSFEFYDGTEWQTSWDTTTMTTRRIPSAVRVTYRFTGESVDHIITFAVPSSDVTPDNPVTTETAS